MLKIPECTIHPISLKLIKSGHPWITADQFSKKFPRNSEFILALDERRRPLALLLHDPFHRNIKARVWSKKNPIDREAMHFTASVQARMEKSFDKRRSLKLHEKRDNYYLIFGEADELPGLFIIKLKDHFLIQLYSNFWEKYKSTIITTTQEYFPESNDENFWIQTRGEGNSKQKLPINIKDSFVRQEFHLQEDGIHYLIKMGSTYDHGLYTDMSAIREKLKTYLPHSGQWLNLFCYTGAFSLWGLALGAQTMVSVDLSPKYLEWLSQNLALNPNLDERKNHNMMMSVDESLDELNRNKQYFDVIICDPPSTSSDGEKRTSALRSYKEYIKKMDLILKPKGKMVVFLNTHQVSSPKFEKTILLYLNELNLKYKISTKLNLVDDCHGFSQFPEGSYLKGLILEKNS